MKNSDSRKLLSRYIEESEVDKDVTESILKKILRFLFVEKRGSEASKKFTIDKKEGG